MSETFIVTNGDILVEIVEELNNYIIEIIEEEQGKAWDKIPREQQDELFRNKTDNMKVVVTL